MAAIIILLNLAWWLSAYYDSREETAWSFPFRMFDWGENWQGNKAEQSDVAHSAGARSVGTLLVLTAVLFATTMYPYSGTIWHVALYGMFAFISCGLVYWRYFDIGYSKLIGMGRFYLGGTAGLDKWLKKNYGEKAGKKKALFCFIGISLCDAAILSMYFLL
jgi:hypothetical protein